VLFRGRAGTLRLIERHCATSRRPTLPLAGWKMAVALRLPRLAVRRVGSVPGKPGRAQGFGLCKNIRQRAYPVVEKSGILWAYLGEGEPPAFPEIDCFVAPDSHNLRVQGPLNCNWLQALEVGIDPSHASFLHRFFEDEDTSAPKASSPRRVRRQRHADDEDPARIRPADHQCRADRIWVAADRAARDRRGANPCPRHQPAISRTASSFR